MVNLTDFYLPSGAPLPSQGEASQGEERLWGQSPLQ